MLHTRRHFLQSAAATAAVLTSRRTLAAVPASGHFTPFGYPQIRLLPSPLLDQFQHNHALFLALDEDALLKPFRQLTNQPAPGEDMGGWYTPSPLFDPPKNMTGYIPGHSFGQYLSGLARAYAVTGDRATQAKIHRLVTGLAPTLTPAFYRNYPLPCYTFDKTLCGLSDAHHLAQTPDALAAINQATDAVLPWLPPRALNRTEMAARPHPNEAYTWDEPYTLPENLFLASQRGAGSRFQQLATRFLQDDTYFGPLAEGRNVIPHQHAYSHLNALCSAMQAWQVTGSELHLRAAQNGFDFIQQQSFATGGSGPNEGFVTPASNELVDSLTHTHNSFETPCGAYGHFKLTRYLLAATGEPRYGDSMEQVLYNTILGARPIRPDGVSFYYADYNNDATKSDYEQKWPCCSGTFPQLTADYGISSYLRSPTGVAVNLYVPSRLSWQQGSALVTLTQQHSYPITGDIALHITSSHAERFSVQLRIPAWAGPASCVMVNGRPSTQHPQPGTFLTLDRTWRSGDHVELSLDMPLRLVPLDPQHPNVVALAQGPTVLFAVLPAPGTLTKTQLLAAKRRNPSSSDHLVLTDTAPILFRSYPAITSERYRLYQTI